MRPTTAGSPPKRPVHRPCDRTTDASARPPSAVPANVRPRAGRTPSRRKYPRVTHSTRAGAASAPRPRPSSRRVRAARSIVRARRLTSANSTHERIDGARTMRSGFRTCSGAASSSAAASVSVAPFAPTPSASASSTPGNDERRQNPREENRTSQSSDVMLLPPAPPSFPLPRSVRCPPPVSPPYRDMNRRPSRSPAQSRRKTATSGTPTSRNLSPARSHLHLHPLDPL